MNGAKRSASAESQGSALGDELFRLVQQDQGYAFISDGWPDRTTKADVIEIAEISLYNTERTARLLRKFLKKHRDGAPNSD